MTKQQQRQKAYDARNFQPDKTKLSKIICEKFMAQRDYQQAQTVLWYLHCRSEVKTLETVNAVLDGPKRVVIPYCTTDQNGENKLGLWWLQDLSELMPGTWGILEPPKSRWKEKDNEILPQDIDFIMVPGVAFDLEGGRLGNGAGYYDRLLQQVRRDTVLTAVCYESQIVDKVIMEKHDVSMHRLITEKNSYLFS
jgi:5-formyltetrahydrofolate cyclo-ligase